MIDENRHAHSTVFTNEIETKTAIFFIKQCFFYRSTKCLADFIDQRQTAAICLTKKQFQLKQRVFDIEM